MDGQPLNNNAGGINFNRGLFYALNDILVLYLRANCYCAECEKSTRESEVPLLHNLVWAQSTYGYNGNNIDVFDYRILIAVKPSSTAPHLESLFLGAA